MNDHSPRRYKGSLLERAAEQFKFDVNAIPPVNPAKPRSFADQPAEAAPEPEPAPERIAPEPVRFVAPEPEPEYVREPEPEYLRQPEPEYDYDPEDDGVFELTEVDAAEPSYALPPAGARRRHAAIDRALLADQGMLAPGGPVTSLAEEFRMVKRQLLLTARAVAGADADRARMILVCSANPNDGKTFCAINLALSMAAEKDMEILLVDADLAKPDVLERLGVPAGPGLLDALSGAIEDVEDCIVETDIPQLVLLPAGTRSHSDNELLASDRARAIFDGLAAANPRRIVIFDSPPALAASMASVLALHVGQVMLVVRADRTSESDLREATNALDGCEHVQLVLNGVSFQAGGRRLGSYYEESAK